jgi:hypothetical protein
VDATQERQNYCAICQQRERQLRFQNIVREWCRKRKANEGDNAEAPSKAAAEGTLEPSDLAVSFQFKMSARSSIKYRIGRA